jgi:hypothetical protein
MDMSIYAGNEWLIADTVSTDLKNPTKARIVDEGVGSINKLNGKKQAIFTIVVDGKECKWKPNATTVQKLIERFGTDSMAWLEKEIELVAERKLINGVVRSVVSVL